MYKISEIPVKNQWEKPQRNLHDKSETRKHFFLNLSTKQLCLRKKKEEGSYGKNSFHSQLKIIGLAIQLRNKDSEIAGDLADLWSFLSFLNVPERFCTYASQPQLATYLPSLLNHCVLSEVNQRSTCCAKAAVAPVLSKKEVVGCILIQEKLSDVQSSPYIVKQFELKNIVLRGTFYSTNKEHNC